MARAYFEITSIFGLDSIEDPVAAVIGSIQNISMVPSQIYPWFIWDRNYCQLCSIPVLCSMRANTLIKTSRCFVVAVGNSVSAEQPSTANFCGLVMLVILRMLHLVKSIVGYPMIGGGDDMETTSSCSSSCPNITVEFLHIFWNSGLIYLSINSCFHCVR